MSSTYRLSHWAALALLSLPSCINLKEVRCNTRYADTAGYEDARQGQPQKPTRIDGQICEEGYSYEQFQKDYEGGFQRGVDEVCREEVARRAGQEDGRAGREDFPSIRLLIICRSQSSASTLDAAYRAAFQQAFCAEERVQALADLDAENFRAHDPARVFASCGTSVSTVAEVYHRRFDLAMQRQCTPPRAFSLGVADARTGIDQLTGARRLEACPRDNQFELLQSYRQGFADAARATAQAQQVQLAAEAARQAEEDRQRRDQQRAARLSQKSIKVKDQELLVQCLIEGNAAHVVVANPSSNTASFSAKWTIRYLTDAHVFLRSDTESHSLLISGGQSADFRAVSPLEAHYCIADVLELL